MPKKKKKASEQNKAAGNSRLGVEPDAYRPFEGIKEIKPKVIRKEQPKVAKPVVSERKEPLIKGYDPKANFGDILTSWEATGELEGVTKRMKSHSKVQVEKSFAEILAQWEGEKADKKAQAEKKAEPIKKSGSYVPTKDFGALLDAFEGNQPAKKRKVDGRPTAKVVSKTPLMPTQEVEEALVEKDELDSERDSSVSWSFADTYRKWNELSDEHAAIQKARKEKKEPKVVEKTIGELRALEPEATLDLHGMTVLEAEKACGDFLHASKDKHLKKVAIITGKGLHNDKGYSLLKEAALSQIRLSKVVREAYTPKACHGGSGVIWIILKSSE